MTSIHKINPTDIFSRFYQKVEAYDLLELTNDIQNEFLCGYLHSASSKPNIKRPFSSIVTTDPSIIEIDNPNYIPNDPQSSPFIEQKVDGTVLFELKYKTKKDNDETADKEFIEVIFGCGIVLEWVTPKVNTFVSIRQLIGTADEKYFSQAAHSIEMRNLKQDYEIEICSLIRDRGFIKNTYLDGESANSKLRKEL